MMQALRARVLQNGSARANLLELRMDITGRVSWLLIAIGIVAGVVTVPLTVWPNTYFLLAYAALLPGLLALLLRRRHATLACHTLAWGSTAVFIVSLLTLPDVWLPYLGVLLLFISAQLITGGEWAVVAAISACVIWLSENGSRDYQVGIVLAVLALGAAITSIGLYALRDALLAAWEAEQHTDRLLIEARERQGSMASVLKSMELATYLTEQANRQLHLARRQAEEAQRMKEQFAANISHELRTPLNLILGFSEMMCLSPHVYGDTHWSPELKRDIYQIFRNSRHLLDMIDDVLDLSRFELSGFTLHKEPTDLNALLEGTAEIAASLFKDRPVQFRAKMAMGLPTMDVDQTRIRQAVLNLLTNAQKVTEQGTVCLEAYRESGEVVIRVSDTGPGIPPDVLPRVFEDFFQVDTSIRRGHHGAGLGLAISKYFVEAQGGRIWAESRVGSGSTFYVSLPIPDVGARTAYPQRTKSLDPAPTGERPTIVVVDPDPSVAGLVQRHVDGFDVVQVDRIDQLTSSPSDGALPLPLQRPRLILQNVSPVRHALRGDDPDLPEAYRAVPVVQCSLPSKAWLASDLAVSACLNKPVSQEQLFRELRRHENPRDILIVDDNRDFCHLIERMLSALPGRETPRVRHAYDGEEGLRMMRAAKPDLVLLDLIMPNVDGFQLLAQKNLDPGLAAIPVVLLTVTSAAEDALVRKGSQLALQRDGGLRLTELLDCIGAIASVLQPRYN